MVVCNGSHYALVTVGSTYMWASANQPQWLAWLWGEAVVAAPGLVLQRRTPFTAGPCDEPARAQENGAPRHNAELAVVLAGGGQIVADTPLSTFTSYARAMARQGGPRFLHAQLSADTVALENPDADARVSTVVAVVLIDSDDAGVCWGHTRVPLLHALCDLAKTVAGRCARPTGFTAAAIIMLTCGPPLSHAGVETLRLAFRAATMAYLHVHSGLEGDRQPGVSGGVVHALASLALDGVVDGGSTWALARHWPDMAAQVRAIACASRARITQIVTGADADLAQRTALACAAVTGEPQPGAKRHRPAAYGPPPDGASPAAAAVAAPSASAAPQKIRRRGPPATTVDDEPEPKRMRCAAAASSRVAPPPVVEGSDPPRARSTPRHLQDYERPTAGGEWRTRHSAAPTRGPPAVAGVGGGVADAVAGIGGGADDGAVGTVAAQWRLLSGVSMDLALAAVLTELAQLTSMPREQALKQLSSAAATAASVGSTAHPIVRAFHGKDGAVQIINFALDRDGAPYFCCRVLGCQLRWDAVGPRRSHELRFHHAPKDKNVPFRDR